MILHIIIISERMLRLRARFQNSIEFYTYRIALRIIPILKNLMLSRWVVIILWPSEIGCVLCRVCTAYSSHAASNRYYIVCTCCNQMEVSSGPHQLL